MRNKFFEKKKKIQLLTIFDAHVYRYCLLRQKFAQLLVKIYNLSILRKID